ncbi:hypothetical protein OBP_304 [Pseudomonas phage OBP]|uniref:hypothetical protein n=1 Tax=Pseudomonas phage OBP TaxID=1124849 RepID=UPI000240D64B|nr:hypothetical protein OBP_304 [Pseudomonas phage OBP]AEV89741.1 hypothetical protein OBP_304 [Pseudomonas phage OBP]
MKLIKVVFAFIALSMFSSTALAQYKEEPIVFFFANWNSDQRVAASIECVNPNAPQGFKVTIADSKKVVHPEYKLYFGVNNGKQFPDRWEPIENYSPSIQTFMLAMVQNRDLFIDRNNRDAGMRWGIGRNAAEAKQYAVNMKARPILQDFRNAVVLHSCRAQ